MKLLGKNKKRGTILSCFFPFFIFLLSCSNGGEVFEAEIEYHIEREYTSGTENRLVFSGDTGDFQFSIDGDGFESDFDKGSVYPIESDVVVYFDTNQLYSLELTLYYGDGSVFLTDTIIWEKSDEVPTIPVAGFSEVASQDNLTKILFAKRNKNITEVWFAGDLILDPTKEKDGKPKFSQPDAWNEISELNSMPLKFTNDDGLKTLRYKFRNIFGNETELRTLYFIQDSVKPICEVIPLDPEIRTKQRIMKFKINASDTNTTLYRVYGATKNKKRFFKFDKSVIFTVEINADPARAFEVQEFPIKMQVKDLAENFCFNDGFTIKYDPDYEAGSLSINDGAYYTDTEEVTLHIEPKKFEEENYDMIIDGQVEASDYTNTWIPYQEEVPVKLLGGSSGSRYARVRFRDELENITSFVTGSIYLKPYAAIQGKNPNFFVSFARIPDVPVEITGCTEAYPAQIFEANVPCTFPDANDRTVVVTYNFPDGSTLSYTKTKTP